MNIETKYLGAVDVKEQDIWTFEQGIPGFPEETRFVILPLPENEIYFILQSIEKPELGFVIVNPFFFFKDYSFDIDDASVEQLGLEQEADTLVYTILTIQDPFEKTTANLQAPLILNTKNKKAKQLILSDSQYKTKHFILPQKVEKG